MVRQSLTDLRTGHAAEWAGALAFYALLAFFPMLLAVAVVASEFADPAWAVERVTALIGQFLPVGTVEAQSIVDAAVAGREPVSVLAVVS